MERFCSSDRWNGCACLKQLKEAVVVFEEMSMEVHAVVANIICRLGFSLFLVPNPTQDTRV